MVALSNENIMMVNGLLVKVVRKKIKNLHLAVCPPDGRVRISVPERLDDHAVRLAVTAKLDWINRKQKIFSQQFRQSTENFTSGASHYYLGKPYVLDVIKLGSVQSGKTARRPSVLTDQKTLVLYVHDQASSARCARLLTHWYRCEMKRLLPAIISKWESVMGVKVAEYRVKRMKTRWGSCNPHCKRIWLNLELIKKPLYCLEYVIVHEMVHFWESGHGDRFIGHMDRIMPQWQVFRDELNRLQG